MMAKNPPQSGPFRLFYHPASSASMRVTLYLRCRGVPVSRVELVSTGLETDHRGIPVFTMPKGDPETEKIGTTDLTAFNPEGRVPILLLPDGRKMTQSGAIVEFIEECLGDEASGRPLLPDDPWLRAEARRIMWIIAADIQPYQNILCLLFIPSGAETLAFGAASQNRPLPVFRLDFRRQQSVTVTGCGDGQIPPHSLQALPARSRTSVWPGSGRWKHPQAADACQLKGTSPPPTVDGVSVCSLSAALTQEYDTAFKDGGTAVSRKRDLDAQ